MSQVNTICETLAPLSNQELINELARRAVEEGIVTSKNKLGIFILHDNLNHGDRYALDYCDGTLSKDGTCFISPEDFELSQNEDEDEEISDKLEALILKSKKFGIELIQAYE